MATFKGTSGTEYVVSINTGTLIRLRESIDVDLMAIVDGELLTDVYGDPARAVKILHEIIEPDLCYEEFAGEFQGDVIDKGIDALLAGLMDFFPKAHRETLEVLMKTSEQGQKKVLEVLNSQAVGEAMDREFERMQNDLIKGLNSLGSESTNLPASSA